MKVRQKIEPGTFIKKFFFVYIISVLLMLIITDGFLENDDFTLDDVTLIRSIVVFLTIIIGVYLQIRSIMKKYICVRSMEQSYKLYITIAIIVALFVSLFYFMYAVKSNVDEIKDGSQYRTIESLFGEKAAQELLDQAADEARQSWYTVWGVMAVASAISIPMARNIIAKRVEDDEAFNNIENDTNNITENDNVN